MAAITTIPVTTTTRDRLRRLGHKGETYDTILQRLVQEAEEGHIYERQRHILETEEFVPLAELRRSRRS